MENMCCVSRQREGKLNKPENDDLKRNKRPETVVTEKQRRKRLKYKSRISCVKQ